MKVFYATLNRGYGTLYLSKKGRLTTMGGYHDIAELHEAAKRKGTKKHAFLVDFSDMTEAEVAVHTVYSPTLSHHVPRGKVLKTGAADPIDWEDDGDYGNAGRMDFVGRHVAATIAGRSGADVYDLATLNLADPHPNS